jgi:hypothetical protein
MDSQPKTLAEKISNQIKTHSIHMRPRAYFIAGAVALGSGFALSVLIAIFAIGVSVFRLRIHTPFQYLQAGSGGFRIFLLTFPWIPLVIAIAFIIMGVVVMRKYDFSYKHAFSGIFIGFLATVVVVGIISDAAGIPEWAEDNAILHSISTPGYENEFWIAGIVRQTSIQQFLIETPEGRTYTVRCSGETEYHPPTSVTQGEWVRVLGERQDDSFSADDVFHQEAPRGVHYPEEEENEANESQNE